MIGVQDTGVPAKKETSKSPLKGCALLGESSSGFALGSSVGTGPGSDFSKLEGAVKQGHSLER